MVGKRILLGVTGSIAAYKAADVASRLGHLGADVRVILTRHASEFVGAPTFRAITLNPVLSNLFDEPEDRKIAHIEAAQSVDLVLVAPASANILAKMAHGIADDLLSTALLATTAPIIAAPAMNTIMLENLAALENLRLLEDRGVEIVQPVSGVLACRTEGLGKLAEVDDIVEAVIERLNRSCDYLGRKVVVTAGPTREPLDPVRYISNRSSGKMGYSIAEAAARRGAAVTLISGPTVLPQPRSVNLIQVSTTQDMLAASVAAFDQCNLFVAAAAPADYTTESVKSKRKKTGKNWTIELRETPEILAALMSRRKNQIVVGFAAETEDLIKNASSKLTRKNLDLIVANDVSADGAGFDVDTNEVTLLWPDGRTESIPRQSKKLVANRILDSILALLR